jgi:hypothetical protein
MRRPGFCFFNFNGRKHCAALAIHLSPRRQHVCDAKNVNLLRRHDRLRMCQRGVVETVAGNLLTRLSKSHFARGGISVHFKMSSMSTRRATLITANLAPVRSTSLCIAAGRSRDAFAVADTTRYLSGAPVPLDERCASVLSQCAQRSAVRLRSIFSGCRRQGSQTAR